MRPRRVLLLAGTVALTVGGGLAAAQTGSTQTVTIQVDSSLSISLDTESVISPILAPTDEQPVAGGTLTYATDDVTGAEITAKADPPVEGNPSADVTLAVLPGTPACATTCTSPSGTIVDGDADPDTSTPVLLTDTSAAIITAITNTGGDVETVLNYTITSDGAAAGEYVFTVTYLISLLPLG